MPRKKAARGSEASSREEMLTLDQAAEALGVSRSTLYRWQTQGRVRGFKVGRQWRYRRSDLDKFGQMTHPSAAAVNVGELGKLVKQVEAQAKGIGSITAEPVPGYKKAKQVVFSSIDCSSPCSPAARRATLQTSTSTRSVTEASCACALTACSTTRSGSRSPPTPPSSPASRPAPACSSISGTCLRTAGSGSTPTTPSTTSASRPSRPCTARAL